MRKGLITVIALLVICKVYSQSSIPRKFQSFRLGMTESTFLSENTDAKSGGANMIYSKLSIKGMKAYKLNKKVSSGDDIEVSCFFYKNKLAVIFVQYEPYAMTGQDFYTVLKNKYGVYKDYNSWSYNDPIANSKRTIEDLLWKNSTTIMNMLYVQELRWISMTYADANIQKELERLKQEKNSSIIE